MAKEWAWPVDLSAFDRAEELSEAEQEALSITVDGIASGAKRRVRESLPMLERLLGPVYRVFDVMNTPKNVRSIARTALLREMLRRGTAYWAWEDREWLEILRGESADAPTRREAIEQMRRPLMAVAYLLCGYDDLRAVGSSFVAKSFCERIFGKEHLDAAWRSIHEELVGWGWSSAELERYLPKVIGWVMLLNRSPRLEDLTTQDLENLRAHRLPPDHRRTLIKISRVLAARGIIVAPIKTPRNTYRRPESFVEDCPQEWISWCDRWRETAPRRESTLASDYTLLLQVGRWLARTHPGVVTPEQWTRSVAAEYVAAICNLTIGELSDSSRIPAEKIGRPVSAWSKARRIDVVRTFFRDCHDWEWMPRRLDPLRALKVPPVIRAGLVLNPRVIGDDVWGKLLWAGLNLTEDDLPFFTTKGDDATRVLWYPLELVRAMAMVWLFAGLRVDEVIRLRVGCVRWQREELPIYGTAETLPKDAVCWLSVPVNKTSPPFDKPVDRAVGEAVEAWEAVRPRQPTFVDEKAAEVVHYLFSYRGQQLSMGHVNHTLIPLLCRKAGVPESDARGNITSHRARSTIASQLLNAEEPMSLLEVQEWLGHSSPETTRHYAQTTQTRLAKSYSDADYFKRNVRRMVVLIDQEAVRNGLAANGEPWKFYDLGHGYCTYDFFQQCPHRMACARCSFYLPKDSAKAQLLEGKANLSRMREEIPLTEEELAAVEDGLDLHEKLLEGLADVPTPAGPTPRQLSTTPYESAERSDNGEVHGATFVPLGRKNR